MHCNWGSMDRAEGDPVTSRADNVEYAELAVALDELADRAAELDAVELATRWPELESRLLARVDADERSPRSAADEFESPLESPLARSEGERIRNLAWEVGVSVDLHAAHLNALRTLAQLLRERCCDDLDQRVTDQGQRARADSGVNAQERHSSV